MCVRHAFLSVCAGWSKDLKGVCAQTNKHNWCATLFGQNALGVANDNNKESFGYGLQYPVGII